MVNSQLREPCPSCGAPKALVASTCAACYKANRAASAATPEQKKARRQQRRQEKLAENPNHYKDEYAKHRETKIASARSWKDALKQDKDSYILWTLKRSARLLNVDPVVVENKYAEIGNKCEACGYVPAEGERRVAVDHDHRSGKFRGFLCGPCNLLLGKIETYGEERIALLVDYLGKRST